LSHFISNERCPKCASQGNDKSGNNLAVYSDQHKYCFACGYYVKGDIVEEYRTRHIKPVHNTKFFRPSNVMSSKALIYLKKYGLTDQEINDNYFWDDYGYLVFNGDKYQNARNFNEQGAKYISRGVIRGNEKIFTKTKNVIIVVEDAVSAIKISRVCSSVPIHNSVIPLELILRLSKQFSHLGVWLDPDKQKETLTEANKASLYFDKVNVIWSNADPKEYSTEEIKKKILEKGMVLC